MRNRIAVLSALVVLLTIGIYFYWTPDKSREQYLTSAEIESRNTNSEMKRDIGMRNVSPTEGQDKPATAKPSRAELMGFAVNQLNQPIDFYGKVVDQHDTPIPGAKIRLKYTHHVLKGSWPSDEYLPVELEADAAGMFRLSGVKGSLISIESISKTGYRLSPHAYLAPGPSNDPSDPMIFRMWKRQGADRLVHHRLSRQGVSVEGGATTFDLFEGLRDSGNTDLKVSLLRTPVHILRGTNRFDWAVTLEVPEGGLLPTQEEMPFAAPAEGYQSKLVFEFKKENEDWTPILRQQFYIKIRGKYFGRIAMEIAANWEPPPTGLTFDAFINPTGSSNLEYDERQSVSTDSKFPPQ